MTARLINLALVQMRCDDTPANNLARALASIADAARAGAGVVVLPELFLGPYFCQRHDDASAFDRAEPVPDGPTTRALAQAARQHRIVLIGGSIYEKAGKHYYNTAPVFNPDGSLAGTYRKTHIPEDPLYHEQHYFRPGDTGIRVFDTAAGKIAPLICYDQWYPEAARIASLQGAELLVYPTAIGVIDESVETNITGDWETMWRSVQVGHAAANNVFVAAVNRVGKEGAITFWGGSFIADPSGKVLHKAGNGEELVMVECDLGRVKPMQDAWRFLANRRPETYDRLTWNNGTLECAIRLAAQQHAGQKDKQGEPYILHPLRAMMNVEGDLARMIAVLHDTVEDTGLTAEDLRRAGFSEEVIAGVLTVTHGKESYADYVIACSKNPAARQAKLADLIDNSSRERVLLRPGNIDRDIKRMGKYLLSYRFLKDELTEEQYRTAMKDYE